MWECLERLSKNLIQILDAALGGTEKLKMLWRQNGAVPDWWGNDMLSSLALDSRLVPSYVSSRNGSSLSLGLQEVLPAQSNAKIPISDGRSVQKDSELLGLLNLSSIFSRWWRPLGVCMLHGLKSPKGRNWILISCRCLRTILSIESHILCYYRFLHQEASMEGVFLLLGNACKCQQIILQNDSMRLLSLPQSKKKTSTRSSWKYLLLLVTSQTYKQYCWVVAVAWRIHSQA